MKQQSAPSSVCQRTPLRVGGAGGVLVAAQRRRRRSGGGRAGRRHCSHSASAYIHVRPAVTTRTRRSVAPCTCMHQGLGALWVLHACMHASKNSLGGRAQRLQEARQKSNMYANSPDLGSQAPAHMQASKHGGACAWGYAKVLASKHAIPNAKFSCRMSKQLGMGCQSL